MTGSAPNGLEDLIDEVLRLSGRLVSATAGLATQGLTAAQLGVLTTVVRSAHPPTVPQIARSLGHSRQAVQRLADLLCALGFVEAVANPDHKLARLLVPTATGRAAYAESDALSRVWAARVAAGLAQEQIDDAVRTLRTLRRGVEADLSAPHVPDPAHDD